jgi:hypothetical protein
MTNNNDDEFDHIDQRVNDLGAAMFGARPRTPTNNTPTAFSNDLGNRVSRSVVEHDGSISTYQGGPQRGMVDPSVKDDTSPFAVIRDSNNLSPIQPSELTYESVVTLRNGQTMKLRSAIDAGFVKQRTDGSYASTSGQSETQKKPDQEHDDLKPEAFTIQNRAADESLTDLVQSTQPTTQLAAVSDLIAKGEISEHNVTQLATQLGLQPTEVNDKVAPIVSAFQQQADTLVTEYGVQPWDVWNWAKENCSAKLTDAMNRHGKLRQTSGYHAVIKDYVSAMDEIAPEQILAAEFGPGLSARKESNGKIILRTPQGEMPWKSAVRAGLIKLGKR